MKHKRKLLGGLVCILLFILMLYSHNNYFENAENIHRFQEIFGHIEKYNNTQISFHAQILTLNNTTQTICIIVQEEPYTYPRLTVSVKNFPNTTLRKRDLIDVIGIIDGHYHVTATYLGVKVPWKDTLIYLRSLPAIPFVLYLFLRNWTFNTTRFYFERRRKKDA